MDEAKCRALKAELARQAEPRIVSVARFFDGNDDLGSIGCNLDPHPGLDSFRDVLEGLLRRPGIQAVYAQISEPDPGDDCWPFSDTVFIVGPIAAAELRGAVGSLSPDSVRTAEGTDVPPYIAERHDSPVSVVWWD
jgi:hypothetical protein